MNKFCFVVPETKDGEEGGRREGGDSRGAKIPFKCLINKCNLLMDLKSLAMSRLEFIVKVLSGEINQYL